MNSMKEIAYLHNFETTDVHGGTFFMDIFILRENGNTETHVFPEYENDYSDAEFAEEEETSWLEEARFIPVPEKELASIVVTIDQAQSVIRDILRGNFGPIPLFHEPYMENEENIMGPRTELNTDYFHAVFVHELQNLVIKTYH